MSPKEGNSGARSAEVNPMSPKGRPEGEYRSAQRGGQSHE